MLDTGYLLYFKDFQFNDGGESKIKYFIILKKHDDKLIVGCLPTRTNRAPSFVQGVDHGCVNKDDRCFNCYMFKAGHKICDTGFSFDLPTFIYGDRLDTYELEVMENNNKINETYIVEGKINDDEFKKIIDCIVTSASTKQKYKKLLT